MPPSREVDVKPVRKIPDLRRMPAALMTVVNGEAWCAAILYGERYKEPDPEFISKMLAAKAMFAETPEEVMDAAGVRRLQTWLPNTPGATTGPLECTDIYVAESDFETGNPTYVIFSAISLETGEEHRYSTGATNIQASFIGLLRNGVWPIRFQVKRGDSKDKGDRYLMLMLPPD